MASTISTSKCDTNVLGWPETAHNGVAGFATLHPNHLTMFGDFGNPEYFIHNRLEEII